MPVAADRPGALVIEGTHIALGVVRSLGRQGIPVWVLKGDFRLAAFSRYARRTLPWPAGDEDRQRDYLLELATRERLDGWAIFPTNDAGVSLLARHHAALAERYYLTTPPWEAVRWAYDKQCTYRLAAQLGLDCPWTHYPSNREEVAALDCAFPVILKPTVKEGVNPFTQAKAWQVENREELLARYDEACAAVDPASIMVQELIPGGGETRFSYAALCAGGRPLATLVARHPRQYPLDFARFSTYAETIEQPEVEEQARTLLAATSYTGLAQLQFKRDPRTGQYKLLDVNVRAWGSHTLGQGAGVDFPYLLWRLVRGESVPQVRTRTGVRWVRMSADIPAALLEIRRGSLAPAEYLRSLLRVRHFATFAPDDPLPALLEAPLLIHSAWKRGSM
jgi:D-aspartate ligase